MSTTSDETAPTGFTALRLSQPGSFIEVNGPLFGKREGNKLVMGFRVQPRHCNPANFCHGAMMLALADMLIGPGSEFEVQSGRFLPTISISADFLAPAPLGAWVEGRAHALRKTASLLFAQCLITADGTPALRASGIMKLGASASSVPAQPDIRSLVP
jgi:acyl-coenzyme A thioesterase PaaI-like protein